MEGTMERTIELDAALHLTSRLLLKHIDCVLILHFQLQKASTKYQFSKTGLVSNTTAADFHYLVPLLRL